MSKQKYIETHLLTALEYYEEGLKYLKWAKEQLHIVKKINAAKNDKNLHKF
jgi:hypothetical protein